MARFRILLPYLPFFILALAVIVAAHHIEYVR